MISKVKQVSTNNSKVFKYGPNSSNITWIDSFFPYTVLSHTHAVIDGNTGEVSLVAPDNTIVSMN